MTTANVAEIKNHFSRYLDLALHGEPVQICKRNVAVAELVPLSTQKPNKTRLGCGIGTVLIHCDLTDPVMDPAEWNMSGKDVL